MFPPFAAEAINGADIDGVEALANAEHENAKDHELDKDREDRW